MKSSACPHTPGPWEACHDMDGDYVVFAGKKIIAITDKDSDEEAANARLIATAPKLFVLIQNALEILQTECLECDGCTTSYPCLQCQIKTAIREARGEQ